VLIWSRFAVLASSGTRQARAKNLFGKSSLSWLCKNPSPAGLRHSRYSASRSFSAPPGTLYGNRSSLCITLLGGTPFKVGVVLACFAVMSVVFRPLIGGWADRRSEPKIPYLRFAVAVCGAASLIHSCRRSGDACQRVARFRLGRIEHLWLFIACLSPPPLWLDEASRYYSGVRASTAILLSTGIAALGLVATILNPARLK
jgi:hypothetical protein